MKDASGSHGSLGLTAALLACLTLGSGCATNEPGRDTTARGRGPGGDHVEDVASESGEATGRERTRPSAAGDERAVTDTAPSIEETDWQLVEINGRPALTGRDGRPPALRLIRKSGTLGASTGVNSLSGSYTLDGTTLALAPGPMTMMAGPPPLMEQERAFVAALRKVNGYQIDGDTLQLLADEAVVLVFERGSSGTS